MMEARTLGLGDLDARPQRDTSAPKALSASEIDARVGSRIRERREALRMSQSRLAQRLGLTFSQIQKYEKGANRVGAGRLQLIADALDVPVSYFFRQSGNDSEGGQDEDGIRDMVLDPDGLELIAAFRMIADVQARNALIALAKVMAEEEQRPGPRAA